ncbi:MAG TPA: hypothetical protein VM536_09095 [Chloroflexia bacterium]|nr:hypothetical protein [Chloroflexia bacterium]
MRIIEDPPRSPAVSLPPGAEPVPVLDRLARAVLRTLAYSDLFDYPLTAAEIARYLVGDSSGRAAVHEALAHDPVLLHLVERQGPFYFLPGRAALVAVRQARRADSLRLWRRAMRYSRLLRQFPFVRMIAVSGALAMQNVAGNPDIDLLVIVTPGRVWICRRLLILAVRAIRLRGDEICPNFILAADHLALPQQDLFTAHELAQMRPTAGYTVYRRMLDHNGWLRDHLPNAAPWPPRTADPAPLRIQRVAERVLGTRALDGWERWEMARLAGKLGGGADDEVACTPHQCKGHTGYYRRHFLARYAEHLDGLGLAL